MIAKDPPAARRKVWPLDRLNPRRLRHNSRDDRVALPEFDDFASFQP